MNTTNGEWSANTVTSLYNKVTVLIESVIFSTNWVDGVRSYTKQKGLRTKNEHINGSPDFDDESEDAKEFRQRLGAVEAQSSVPASSSAEVSKPRKLKVKAKAPKRRCLVKAAIEKCRGVVCSPHSPTRGILSSGDSSYSKEGS